VTDDPILWSFTRHDVDSSPRIVAFLGASRMALGYSPDAFAFAAPDLRGIQLSISDNLPFTVLADLAADESFRGVAVIDLIEPEIADPLLLTDSQGYVDRSHALLRVPGAVANRYLASHAQSHLAILGIGGRRIVTSLAGKRRWPSPAWVAIDRDRISHGDYTLAEPSALRARADRRVAGLPAPPSPDAWLSILDRHLEPLVHRIRARGGDVVVLHMPITGQLAERVDKLYPRHLYWDAFAAKSSAHVLHFRDLPAMASLTCPDEMHLDQRDQAAFTRALVEALRARGIFRGRTGT
jgi:hypothetical protein